LQNFKNFVLNVERVSYLSFSGLKCFLGTEENNQKLLHAPFFVLQNFLVINCISLLQLFLLKLCKMEMNKYLICYLSSRY
jgi:hypothetical protein